MASTISSWLSSLKSLSTPITSSRMMTFLFIFLVANIKSLPFVWHFRFLRALTTRLLTRPSPSSKKNPINPTHLFLPVITTTRSPLLECDYNIHKSNSTYFSDLDISRTHIFCLLFGPKVVPTPLNGRNSPSKALPILGGVQCSFRREILPYQGYEIWTRVLSWDEKWVYVVSHFVVKGKVRPVGYVLQGGRKKGGREKGKGKMDEKYVLASSVARYVFKRGRKTIAPWEVLVDSNLLPEPQTGLGSSQNGIPNGDNKADEASASEKMWERIEEQRKKTLEVAQLKGGWDAIHGLFSSDDEEVLALGRYTDLLWR
ncbi:hypothetical protein FQN54_003043 [Arachnomyces sp. PD_36]|nr:hypothetical protein FQN54_003043 [Arachnomyces sp. PD_36]